uniref:Uncharacterized protein n=1 Tax=Micromonas pusilla TaxID=38833 RepID=A0A7S0IKW2_MICPS|mmetsp:Transcript_8725/g.35722  ORF Transcript_8725/g.35722 Transcript_8725/m.35722 type:complete len:708 (+) Transcript_8725:28-2151(+)
MGFHDTTPLWTAAEGTPRREGSGRDAGPSRAADDEVRERVAHLQALASSVRTRLGRGPRMKAHADDGAWAERTTVMTTLMGRASELAGAFERRRGVAASGAHGYANWDDGSLAHGELVSDLAGLLVALGGPRPHPVVGLALTSVTGESCGAGGGTWGLVFAGLLAGHAQRLRAEHDLGFAECCEHYEAAAAAAEMALAKASTGVRDITRDDNVTDRGEIAEAVERASATVRTRGDFGSDRPGRSIGDSSETLARSGWPDNDNADAIDVAALVLGFDRERFPGDVDVALAAALLLVASPREGADGSSSSGDGAAGCFVTRFAVGVPAERSRVVPGVFVPLEPRHVAASDGEWSDGVVRLREAIEARNEEGVATAWRTVLVAGDVPPASAYSDPKYTDRSEGYVDDVCAAVGAAGAVDAILCAGRCDDAVARALARRVGVRAVIQNLGEGVGGESFGGVSSRWPRSDPRAVRDLRECSSGNAVEMCLDASARGGWDPDERRSTRREGSVTYLSATYLGTPRLVTAVLCHPVREVAEARAGEVGRLVRRVRRTLANGGRVVPGGGVAELVAAASLTAELAAEESKSVEESGPSSEERVVRRALAREAFAQSARELCHIASQNHGVPYDEASTRAARAEGLCAEGLRAEALGSKLRWAEASRVLGGESGRLRLEPVAATGLGVAMDITRRVLVPSRDDAAPGFTMSMRVVR